MIMRIAVVFCICLISAAALVQEVVQPEDIPANSRNCSQLLFKAEPLGTSLVQAEYEPPTDCGEYWPKVMLVLKGSAAASELQNNSQQLRVGGVWIDAVQILSTSTPAPGKGVEWSLESDITSYARMFKSRSKVTALFSNISGGDQSNVGLYNVSLSVVFYHYTGASTSPKHRKTPRHSRSSLGIKDLFEPPVVIPLAAPLSNLTGHWLLIGNANESISALATVPDNTIGAYLDVFVSPQGAEEFWYKNTEQPFREVRITLDDKLLVDAIWPFPVAYNRGSYWQSVAAIGSFNSVSYYVSLNQFVALLADGKSHKFSFQIVNAKKSWLLGANLVADTDSGISKISEGGLISSHAPPVEFSKHGNKTFASRTVSSAGFVEINGMNFTRSVVHRMRFVHDKNNGVLHQIMDSELTQNDQGSSDVYDDWTDKSLFALKISKSQLSHSFVHSFESALALGNSSTVVGSNFTSSFENHQTGATNGTSQRLGYQDSDDKCYSRSLFVANFVFKYDNVTTSCPGV